MEPNMPTGETMSEGDPSGTEASTTAEGQEKENSSSLSPEFIKMTQSLIQGASAEQLAYIEQCLEDEQKSQDQGGATDGTQGLASYSSADMPKD